MKKYAPRSDKSRHHILGIKACECGHYDYDHVYGFFSRNGCEECLCPKFKKEKDEK
jgi:hypothetical protein